ncbi:MazG-like family protein [Defluviitalea phaphyphila]|uniref:MazG-like family protein n=1 Tax=Defluviitalea phaphyphila TaxID=1473580 RepID=UPI00072FE832|nr:MazG-like family protein [Defluviitalea phaphyphila]
MGTQDKEFDITKSLKIVEKLKSQILSDVANLFSGMVDYNEQSSSDRSDTLANIIILTYLLSKRLGIPYSKLDMKIKNKLKLGILESSNEKEWFADLTALLRHLDGGYENSRRL